VGRVSEGKSSRRRGAPGRPAFKQREREEDGEPRFTGTNLLKKREGQASIKEIGCAQERKVTTISTVVDTVKGTDTLDR